MTIKTNGRSRLVLVAASFLMFSGGALQAAPDKDDTTATSKSDRATARKYVRHGVHQWKRHTHRTPVKDGARSTETKKAGEPEMADASSGSPSVSRSIANANAQMASSDLPASPNSARAMSERAGMMLLAATGGQTDAAPAAESQVVVPDQLNEVDRSLEQSPAPAQTVAMAPANAAVAAPVLVNSDESSNLDETSLIGKIFIAFGALLTMASAARMFMA